MKKRTNYLFIIWGGKTTKFYQKKVIQQYDDIFVNEIFEKKGQK